MQPRTHIHSSIFAFNQSFNYEIRMHFSRVILRRTRDRTKRKSDKFLHRTKNHAHPRASPLAASPKTASTDVVIRKPLSLSTHRTENVQWRTCCKMTQIHNIIWIFVAALLWCALSFPTLCVECPPRPCLPAEILWLTSLHSSRQTGLTEPSNRCNHPLF